MIMIYTKLVLVKFFLFFRKNKKKYNINTIVLIMSLSYVPLKPIRIIDPVTNVDSVHDYAVLQGGSKISWKAYTSTSISNSSIQFSCPPPSGNIIVDRDIHCTIPIRLTITGTVSATNGAFVPNSTLLNSNFDAPRALPFSSALDTLQVGINNDSVSINMSDIIHMLTRYNIDGDLRSKGYSTTPNYPDQSFNYSDLQGTNRNPLGSYGSGHQGEAVQRGGFPFTVVSNPVVVPTTGAGTAAIAIVDILITEPLFLSPFFWGKSEDNTQGFYNVNSMDFNLTFLAQAGMRMWSHSDAPIAVSGADSVSSNITSISVQFNGFAAPAFSYGTNTPQMLFKYLTPNLLSRQMLTPTNPISYPYFDVTRFPTDIGTVATGAGAQIFQSNNIQLNSIPRRMYIFARPSNSVLQSRADITDTYLSISNVSIQFANQSTLLTSATQAQLFQLNTKNNCEMSWNEWSGQGMNASDFSLPKFGGTGGALSLSFGDDIQLDGDESPGLSGQYQIQVQISLTNSNTTTKWDALPMTLYLVFVHEGVFTITGTGSAQHQIGVLSKMDILDAQKQPGINYRSLQRVNGGDFLGSLGNFASKINDFLKQSKVISTVASMIPHPIAQTVAPVVKSLGYGAEYDVDYTKKSSSGGQRLSKADLRRSLMYR